MSTINPSADQIAEYGKVAQAFVHYISFNFGLKEKPPLPPGVTRHKALPATALQLPPDAACFMKGK